MLPAASILTVRPVILVAGGVAHAGPAEQLPQVAQQLGSVLGVTRGCSLQTQQISLCIMLDPGLTLLHVVFRVFPRVLTIIGSTTEEGTLRPRFPDAQTLGRDRCAAAGCP